MNNKTQSLLGGVALCGLGAAAFAWGTHLGPAAHPGHNLYARQASAATPGLVQLASATGTPARHGGPVTVAAQTSDQFSVDSPGATFEQVYQLVKRYYVDPLPGDTKLGHGAASAMLASLQDPNSRFLEPADIAELTGQAKGVYHGLGATLAVRKFKHTLVGDIKGSDYTEYRLTVIAPLPGSPAEKAGLAPGDVITDIDKKWIATYDPIAAEAKALRAAQDAQDPPAVNRIIATIQKKIDGAISLNDAENKLNAPSATPLALVVTRPNAAAPLTLSVDTSAATTITPVSGKLLTGNIGYVKITQFTDSTGDALASTLTGLGTELKGLIVDLRNSPGGMLDAGSAVAAQLTTANTIGALALKGKTEVIPVTPARKVTCQIVALVNGGTANTSELVAETLRAQGAKLIGEPTFGDASDVAIVKLRDGSGFTMTVGKLLPASRIDFSAHGLRPDIAAAPVPGTDAPLSRAMSELTSRVARLPQ